MLTGQLQAMEIVFSELNLTDRQRNEIISKISKVIEEELEPALIIFAEKQAPLLADVYEYDELQGILSFYESPAGQAMLSKQNELVEKSILVGQQWNQENLPDVLDRMKPRIAKIVEDAKNGI